MAAEIWDLYDAKGQKTGKTMIRGQEVPPGLYHIGVHIWPLNANGEFLVQRPCTDSAVEARHMGGDRRLGHQR